LDLALEKRLQATLRALIQDDRVTSAHDVSEGGLAVALVECCDVGATIALPESGDDLALALFGEGPSRVIVTARPGAEIRAHAGDLPCTKLGTTGGDRLVISRAGTAVVDLSIA